MVLANDLEHALPRGVADATVFMVYDFRNRGGGYPGEFGDIADIHLGSSCGAGVLGASYSTQPYPESAYGQRLTVCRRFAATV